MQNMGHTMLGCKVFKIVLSLNIFILAKQFKSYKTLTMKKPLISVFFLFLFIAHLGSQSLYEPLKIQKCYQDGTRSHTGMPGPNYWKNTCNYDIKVMLKPDRGNIRGSELISYSNNSPDTLKELVITILSDLYKKGNLNDFSIPQSLLNDGVKISKFRVNGNDSYLNSSKITREGTNMIVTLDELILPGTTSLVEIDWEFDYPGNLTIRNGNYGDSTFFIGYFYPKMAVYDDVDGWDKSNYTGYTEFYGEHSDYDVKISVPGDFKVWASGELQNVDEVLSEKYAIKWKEAQKSDKVYKLITADNYLDQDITQNNEWNTWHFKSTNIPDFAFGTSDKFLWDLINVVVDQGSGRKTTLNAAYRLDSKDYYKMAELGKKVLEDYSTRLPGIPYPYPEMTIFNGNSGMEFPMMCNNVSCEEWHETAGLAYHEMGHSYFPFFIGTNERKYAWMDEGWASLFPYFYSDTHSPQYDYLANRMGRYYNEAGSEREVPLMTQSDLLHIRGPYRQASYNKSFFAYFYLYTYLGEETFSKALQGYMNAWAEKHPVPFDFFYSFNTIAEMDLNWFWKNWFFDKNHSDLAISEMKNGELIVENRGKLILPVFIEVNYKDGSSYVLKKDISVWKDQQEKITIPIKDYKKVSSIVLGNDEILDVDKSNNILKF